MKASTKAFPFAAANTNQRFATRELDTMTISAAPAASTGVATQTTATAPGMKVELEKLRKEHSACVNCASAETDVGKRNIQRLETQIAQIEARLGVQGARPTESVDSTVSSTSRSGSIDAYA
ncbi:MAG TPA: hypothetical protein VGN07_09965 [Steroidobacteraceae bacterium]|jgi:hypothetical protein